MSQKSLLTKLTAYIVVLQVITIIAGIAIGIHLNATAAAKTQCNPVNHPAILVIVTGSFAGLMTLTGLGQAIFKKNRHDIKKALLLLVICYVVVLISLWAADFIDIGCGATPF